MPTGFEYYLEDGTQVVDTTQRVFKYLGSVPVNNTTNAEGSFVDERLLLGDSPEYWYSGEGFGPRVTFSGSTLSWDNIWATAGATHEGTIHYGFW